MAKFTILDRPARAPDDRGAVVPLLNTRELGKSAPRGSPKALLARHLDEAVKAEARRFSWRDFGIGAGAVGVWFVVLVIVNLTRLRSLPFVSPGVFWGGLALLMLVSNRAARRRASRHLAATAVSEGICGSCGYSLEALAPQDDGCLLCPECGSAWKGLRVTRPHWDPERPRPVPQPSPWLRWVTGTPPAAARLTPDDRGRYVPAVDSRLRSLPRARRDELGNPRVRLLRRRLRRTGRWGRLMLGLPLGALALGCGVGAGGAARQSEPRTTVVSLAGIAAVFGAVAVAALLGHGFIHPRRSARIMLAEGLCGSCATSLAGLRAAADGCVACPMCGAAWRAESAPDASNGVPQPVNP